MEITYLKKLSQNKKIGGDKVEGVHETEIKAVEIKLRIKFPQAYREFLYIAGKYTASLPMMDTNSLKDTSSGWFLKLMKEKIEEKSIPVGDKPYWIFAHSDTFLFFYLENGVDDPEVFYTDYSTTEEYKEVVKSYGRTFSQYISDAIDDAYKIEKDGW